MTQGIKPELFPFRRALALGASSSRRAWSRREGLCLRLESPSGEVGWGEASPLPGYSPESLRETTETLEAAVLDSESIRGLMTSAEPASIRAHVTDGLRALSAERVPIHGSARFALETALLDLAGRAHGLPMPALWSGDRALGWGELRIADFCSDAERFQPTPGPTTDSMESSWSDPSRPEPRVLKVKVGREGAFGRELRALWRIRRQDPNLELRLDANGAWPRESAIEKLRRLSELPIRWIEEPTTLRDKDELAQWIAGSPVPIALDESVWRLAIGAEDLDRLRPAALILKPHVLGGTRCLELGRAALNLGIDTVVSHLFDGPLAYRSSFALALALDWMKLQRERKPTKAAREGGARQAHGLARHPGLSAWPEAGGALSAPPSTWGPGLGLSWEMP